MTERPSKMPRRSRPARRAAGEAPPSPLARWATIAGQIGAVLTLVTTVVGFATSGFKFLRGEHGRVVVDNLVVSNGPEADLSQGGGGQEQTASSTPTIRVTLRNAGNGSVYLRTAHVKIVDSEDFRTCYSQGGGDVPTSNPISIVMPVRPVAGTTLDVPLDKTLDPKDRTAFPLLFGRGLATTAWGLYAVQVSFDTDEKSGALELGRFLIAVPGSSGLERSAFPVLPGTRPVKGTGARFDLGETWCYRSNLARLQALTALPGKRAPETADLSGARVASDFNRYADQTPARQAAQRLAADDTSDGDAYYAIFAAEQTHDAAFVAQIRQKVIATFTARAERQLAAGADDVVGALDDARTANQLAPSAATKQLVGDAERAFLAARPDARATGTRAAN